MDKNEYIEQCITDTLMERPFGFKIKDRRFYLYPTSFGKVQLLLETLRSIKFDLSNFGNNPYEMCFDLIKFHRNEVCKIIAYNTAKDKDTIFDCDIIEERMSFFNEVDNEDLAELLMLCLTNDNLKTFMSYLKIDKEKQDMEKVLMHKKDSGNNFTFGGKSIYGSFLDAVCERYHWTLEYVIWGISYSNLQLLMADRITSVYLTDEEKKSCRIPNDRTVINADDKNNFELIKAMFK